MRVYGSGMSFGSIRMVCQILKDDIADTYTPKEACEGVRYILATPTHLRDIPDNHRKVGIAENGSLNQSQCER
jgi:hypothetical protein